MSAPSPSLQHALQDFMAEVPFDIACSLCERLKVAAPSHLAELTPISLGPVPYPQAADIFCATVRECCRSGLVATPSHLAAWLTSIAATVQGQPTAETTELVWTGPLPDGSLFRRTDQALLEVIQAAERQLLLVSFAIFKVEQVSKALKESAARGIEITVVLEDRKQTAPATGMMKEFRGVESIRFLIWPEDKRMPTQSGQHGAMHAKCAVADEHMLFVSSANLTEYALTINMEMGLLIRHGDMPKTVARHFASLLSEGVLVPLV